jgi:hypothetical protein
VGAGCNPGAILPEADLARVDFISKTVVWSMGE